MAVVALWPLDTSEVTGHGPDLRLHVAFRDSLGHRVNIDLGCGRITDPDMVLGSRLGLVVSIPGGSKGHPDQYGPSSSLDRDPKCGQRRQPRLLESA